MLARVLGAEVRRSLEPEIGWLPVRSADPDLVPQGPWFQWHFDVFEAPPGAEVIAESDLCPQAFVYGRSLGLQFHPEVTRDIMDGWIRVYRHELDHDGVDPDELMRETHRRIDESNRMARHLLERFLERVAGIGGGGTTARTSGAI
jgi:GMP synthase-like glutamine amidotransferase